VGLRYNIDLPLDSPERTLLHREIIMRKTFLKKLYSKWYSSMVKELQGLPQGQIVELGSGGGFFKEFVPDAICSDILDLPGNDMTFSALDMPFEDGSVSAIFMVDTFHHIPDSTRFLEEAKRVFKPGGLLMMIEPANSWWGRFIYRNFHHEPFDPSGEWTFPLSGPMSGANGALPWIVFERDQALFSKRFPSFKIDGIFYHTPLLYLLSGGVSFRQLVPAFSYGAVELPDRILSRLFKGFSMFVTIRIRKR
jgi:SAM-dependent methyltransferase